MTRASRFRVGACVPAVAFVAVALVASVGRAQVISFDNSCGSFGWSRNNVVFTPPAHCECDNNWATGIAITTDCSACAYYPGSGDDVEVGIPGSINDTYARFRSLVTTAQFSNDYVIEVSTTAGYHAPVVSHGAFGGVGVHSFFDTLTAYPNTDFFWPTRAHFFAPVTIPALGALEIDTEVFNHSTFTWACQPDHGFYIDGAAGGPLAVLRNLQGATFLATTDAQVRGIIALGHIENSGTFRKDGGLGTSQITVEFINRPSGLIDVRTGTVRFDQPCTFEGAATIAANCVIECTFAHTVPTTFNVSGPGLFKITSNFTVAAGATLNAEHFDSSSSNVTPYFTGTGTINVSSTAYFNGRVADPMTFNFLHGCATSIDPVFSLQFESAATANNHGVMTWLSGNIEIAANSHWSNASDGQFELRTAGASMSGLGFVGEGTFSNAGLMRKTAGALTQFTLPVTNTGRVECTGGTLAMVHYHQTAGETVMNGGTLFSDYQVEPLNFEGGSLKGIGQIKGPVRNSGGTISPGSAPNTAGTFLMAGANYGGDFEQTAGGTLDMEIGGPNAGSQYDQLIVDGTTSFASATLGGTLRVRFINGYAPTTGAFDVLLQVGSGSVSGTFDSVDAPPGFTVEYTPDHVRLNYVKPCSADFNNDEIVNFFDYLDFVALFSSNAPEADFNGDMIVDFFDYLDFVGAFSVGC